MVDPALRRQISGMGNNLDQIARLLHQSPSFSPSERVQLLAVLTSMDHQLSVLLAEYRCDDC
ncbi:plasmid mobilization relaxosome protein MobC [Escherichia coli]|uniref:plasmid mobilization relaxosome protein MobC n=1 Tax=Escherichia coli TaxID=562 RepID=UPI000B7D7067|nr:plasmid mobilization relaxosome protein MobC [Escherichia coli]